MSFLIKTILKHQAHGAHQWPCLVGPTGAGKTARVKALAREAGRPVISLLLGTMLPEDVLGLPRVIRGVTQWALPEWADRARQEPCVLFLDELDKARPETWAAVLTLLTELSVRDVQLHPETWVVAAMQPVSPEEWLSTETGRALSARLIFLPVAYDWAHVASKIGVDAARLAALGGVQEPPALPVLPTPSPRQIEGVAPILRALLAEGRRDDALSVAKGVVGPLAEALLELLPTPATPVGVEAYLDAIAEDPSSIQGLTPAEAIALIPSTIAHHGRTWINIAAYVARHGTADDLESLARTTHQALAQAAGAEDTLEVWRDFERGEDFAKEATRVIGRAIAERALEINPSSWNATEVIKLLEEET